MYGTIYLHSTSIVSIIRMKALVDLDLADATYQLPLPLMWSVVEPELALVCANLPLTRPALSRLLGGLFGDSQQQYAVSDTPNRQFNRLGDNLGSMNKSGRALRGRKDEEEGGERLTGYRLQTMKAENIVQSTEILVK